MLHTISELIPYDNFNPETTDFMIWERGLERMFRLAEDIDVKMKFKVLMYYLPAGAKYEVLQEYDLMYPDENMPDYDRMIGILKDKYTKKITLMDFTKMYQSKEDSISDYLNRVENFGKRLKIDKKDIIDKAIDGVRYSLRDKVAGNNFNGMKELKETVERCEKYLTKSERMETSSRSFRSKICDHCKGSHSHDYNECKKKMEKKDKTPKNVNFISKVSEVNVQDIYVASFDGLEKECILDTGADISVISSSEMKLDNRALESCN